MCVYRAPAGPPLNLCRERERERESEALPSLSGPIASFVRQTAATAQLGKKVSRRRVGRARALSQGFDESEKLEGIMQA